MIRGGEDQIWNFEKMIAYLEAHGLPEGGFYTVDGLGGGEIDGIEQIDDEWFTYFSQRGQKRNYVKRRSEHDACQYVIERTEKYAKRLGVWKS